MPGRNSFKGCCIVSCGIMRLELESLRQSGFLDADKIIYTPPGLHEWPWELEKHLPRQLAEAAGLSAKTIVVYGKKCFIDLSEPERMTDALIREHGTNTSRIGASNCVDMLVSLEERAELAGSERVHWLTPGWLQHWSFIYKDWDAGKANEMFPYHNRAVVLDAVGYFDRLMTESPETILEISDWMKVPLDQQTVPLDRLRGLLLQELGDNHGDACEGLETSAT